MADEIAVPVTKVVPIDRDGATVLVKAFIEWFIRDERENLERAVAINGAEGAFILAKEFTDRYGTIR